MVEGRCSKRMENNLEDVLWPDGFNTPGGPWLLVYTAAVSGVDLKPGEYFGGGE